MDGNKRELQYHERMSLLWELAGKPNQEELAGLIGKKRAALNKKLNGGIPFSLEEIELLADYFGICIGSFFIAKTEEQVLRLWQDKHLVNPKSKHSNGLMLQFMELMTVWAEEILSPAQAKVVIAQIEVLKAAFRAGTETGFETVPYTLNNLKAIGDLRRKWMHERAPGSKYETLEALIVQGEETLFKEAEQEKNTLQETK